MAKNRVRLLHEDCDPDKAKDPTLPYTAYLVEYKSGGFRKYDIAMCTKTVDLFDYYWDKYGKDFVRFDQSDGKISPKLWQPPK
tara:strand:- start:16432 stop:16680 length:249 start_codon:yes stop_codon:yes gene_type:complete